MRWIDLPPVWTLAAAALMWGTARLAPWPGAGSLPLALAIFAAAMGLFLWAGAQFRRRRTTIIPREAPSALIAEGPFRFTRNPIYLADALILAAWAAWLGALLPLLWIPVFVALVTRRFIVGEEARLQAAFGAEFDAYRRRVRRWI